MVALEAHQGTTKVIRIHPLGSHKCVYKVCFVGIHGVDVEIFDCV